MLTRVGLERGRPAAIPVDHETEFTAWQSDHWAYTHRVELDYSRPGKPTDNAFIEAFNSLVRRERLSQHYSSTLEEARHVLEGWREEYNNHRPHGSLRDRTPAEYRSGRYHVLDRTRLLMLGA